MSLKGFLRVTRAQLTAAAGALRIVSISELSRFGPDNKARLEHYLADRAPLFYRKPHNITESILGGFVSGIRETLQRLPTSEKFQESHFGEILAHILAEDVLGWRLLYSKFSLNTTPNDNPHKIDLAMYDPTCDPVELILGSVKSSPKNTQPANHDKSCYSDLFRSFNHYGTEDVDFDLVAARDNLTILHPEDITRVKAALHPHASPIIRYSGFTVIDLATKSENEMALLMTQRNNTDFNVEAICVENFADTAHSTFSYLESIRAQCLR